MIGQTVSHYGITIYGIEAHECQLSMTVNWKELVENKK
jgi:hypothetical protein